MACSCPQPCGADILKITVDHVKNFRLKFAFDAGLMVGEITQVVMAVSVTRGFELPAVRQPLLPILAQQFMKAVAIYPSNRIKAFPTSADRTLVVAPVTERAAARVHPPRKTLKRMNAARSSAVICAHVAARTI